MGEKDAILVDHVQKLKDGAKKVEDADKARILTLEQGTTSLQTKVNDQNSMINTLNLCSTTWKTANLLVNEEAEYVHKNQKTFSCSFEDWYLF